MLARPDPSTFGVLPWRTEQQVARMFCDIATPDGEPFSGDPRIVLKRNRAVPRRWIQLLRCSGAPVLLLQGLRAEPEVLDHGGYFDTTPLDVAQDYRRDTINALEQMGIPIEHSHHEVAPSQHEIIARYTDALDDGRHHHDLTPDGQGSGPEHGIYATFMPKPLEEHDGSGMHLHCPLRG